MLEIYKLTKVYAANSTPSVDKLTLSVADGEIFGFIGPNGAGKSTTIKCIAGILPITEGSIVIDGVSLADSPLEAKRLLGYVSDDHVMYEGLTGLEFVNFIADIFKVPSAVRKERLESYLDVFGLASAIKQPISTYSHGMKQKLNVIGALIHEPKLLMLDEPMTGLDPKSAYALKKIMREYADRGNIVFFSSHVLEVVEKICDRVGIIDGGKLIVCCDMEELKERNKDKSLEELFLKLTETPDLTLNKKTALAQPAETADKNDLSVDKAEDTLGAVSEDKNAAEKVTAVDNNISDSDSDASGEA